MLPKYSTFSLFKFEVLDKIDEALLIDDFGRNRHHSIKQI